MWNPLRRLVTRVGRFDPLLLMHHPECTRYSRHTFALYGQQVCMGCFIVYPVGFVSLLSLVVGRLLAPGLPLYDAGTVGLYAAGFTLISPKVTGKLVPGRRAHRTRMVTKLFLAVGLAFVAFPFFFRPEARLTTVALFFGFLVPYVGHKALTITDECEDCPYQEEFPNCPGMDFDGEIIDPDRQYKLETREAEVASNERDREETVDTEPAGQVD